MRVAIAGLGSAATRGHLPALLRLEAEGRAAVVGACDPDPRRRLAAERAIPGLATFSSADEMLAAVPSDLFAIASPPGAHTSLAALAASYGQHVLCEKPAGGTPSQTAALSEIWRRHPDRGLAAAYQYRFSPPWILISRFLRAAARGGRRVAISVDVRRPLTDRHALSNWRDDPATGGGLADHGVHYLALARVLEEPLEVLASRRDYDGQGREQVSARCSFGPHLLDLSVSYRARGRSTSLIVECDGSRLGWTGGDLTLKRADGRNCAAAVSSLADRTHVDALYEPMYRDLLAGIGQPRWRRRRAEEVLEVGRDLTVLLAAAGPVLCAPESLALVA